MISLVQLMLTQPLHPAPVTPPQMQDIQTDIFGIPLPLIITSEGAKTHKDRVFRTEWQQQHPWLQHSVVKNVAWCQYCVWATIEKKFLHYIREVDAQRTTFARGGWTKWKQGTSHLAEHASSAVHNAAAIAFIAHKERHNIAQKVDIKRAKERQDNRLGLKAVLDTVMFLARQGLALRGHTDNESNFQQLLQTLGRHNENVLKFSKTRHNWSSPDIQNEMLKIVDVEIMETVLSRIRKSGIFAIIAYETTDASVEEQMSIIIRYFDIDELEVFEIFLGFLNVPDTKAETLFNAIKDVLQQCNLPLAQARGQCYDGASNMRGHVSGVQARMLKENPYCLYVYCIGHNLNLVVQEATKALIEGSKAMTFLQSCTTYIRDSPKRLQEFTNILSEVLPSSETNLRPLCHTRWVMRFRSLDSFVKKYPVLLQWYEERQHDSSLSAEIRAKSISFLQQLERFETFFMMRAMRLLFGIVDPVHKAVQGVNEKIGDVKRRVNMLKETLQIVRGGHSRTGDAANLFYQVTKQKANELQIDIPALPRGKVNIHRGSSTLLEISEDDILNYSGLYRSLFDAAITGIDSRYHTPSMELASVIEIIFTRRCTLDDVEKVS